ncbi:MAG: GNAT family N-acetyltransferase [Clostridiales bacterium]|nr:GNAT family N-acetyltransferase [Clostridiales bacterium]
MPAKLITPSEAYLQSYLTVCRDCKARGITAYPLHDPDDFETWRHTIFQSYENKHLGIGLKEGRVPSSTFWLVKGGEFIGEGNIRHCLTEALERYGGHIGYCIRPDYWRKGYGTLQLRLLLAEAARLGLPRVLITCDEDNLASARVMEKSGAVYQDTIGNIIEGIPTRTKRYWADTVPCPLTPPKGKDQKWTSSA